MQCFERFFFFYGFQIMDVKECKLAKLIKIIIKVYNIFYYILIKFDLKWLFFSYAAVNRDIVSLTSSVKRFPPPKPVRCNENSNLWQPCQCRLEICVGWYPCGLKYCRGKDSSGKAISYRCGIKTCRKCRAFDFFVQQKQQCLWDE